MPINLGEKAMSEVCGVLIFSSGNPVEPDDSISLVLLLIPIFLFDINAKKFCYPFEEKYLLH